ncbi:ubiquinol-cytochrome c reductase iron-sulfur subunit [Ornithinicoccus hortensis]|uniref:Cytochrome bc1 complex Rieske iron-sulfur subunit n=1 Tax=Ornithinicoccus hortensis TaxID=82346 RepID=A0A542YRB2_9MICO|nr:Rieske 2Fe-2S domain-containing protein [Ornithinicoccus hortensis]TQL50621.1 menaquinol-cytochrome c reductase iron-sulfur subunit precursor [Ornithinicoccus hortensis]
MSDTTQELAPHGGENSAATTDRFENPGIPPHVPRRADVDPKAAKRAERQVAALFTLSMLGTLGFIAVYFFMEEGQRGWVFWIGEMDVYHLGLGLTLAVSLLGIGLGAGHWAKTLMSDVEVSEERHPQASDDQARLETAQHLSRGYRSAQLNRRPLLLMTAGGALSLFALPLALQVAGGLGPLPGNKLSITNWKKDMRLMIDPSGTPIRPEHVTQGSVFHVMPEGFVGEAAHELDPSVMMTAKAKDSIILVRLDPAKIKSSKQREWGYQGIVAYSKICTHVGCPVALYEQQTHHLLCPCHQSTFDMTDDCKVIFGPAKRPLPQLPITVDGEGYLVAADGFAEPVGPSFWERG